jgi:hypothetical protein
MLPSPHYNDFGVTMPVTATKEDAHRLIENLPDEFEWEQLMKLIYEQISIDRGIDRPKSCAANLAAVANAGRLVCRGARTTVGNLRAS